MRIFIATTLFIALSFLPLNQERIVQNQNSIISDRIVREMIVEYVNEIDQTCKDCKNSIIEMIADRNFKCLD